MRKLVFTISAIAMSLSSMAQSCDLVKQINDAKAKIEKTATDCADAKKGILPKTWLTRANVLMEADGINTKGVYAQMDAAKTDANPFNNMELMMGNPADKQTEGEHEVWIYPTVKFYVKNNKVDFWKETTVADKDALGNAENALKKALELDAKGTLKSSKPVQEAFSKLREKYFNKGVNDYFGKDYASASKAFAAATGLADMPKLPKDTLDGQYAYYGGLSAMAANESDLALKCFDKAIEYKYEPGASYHQKFVIYTDLKQSDKALQTAKEGYAKFPKEESILYDVINYYLSANQPNEAEGYLDKAIENYPSNLGLYDVKAGMFVKQYNAIKDNYLTVKAQADDSLRKASFKNRNNASEKARIDAERAAKNKEAASIRDQYLEVQKKAIEQYKLMESKDPKNFNCFFNRGFVYYEYSELIGKEIDLIHYSEDADGSKANAKKEEQKAAWKSACECFEKANAINPQDKTCLSNMRILYQKLGDYAKAKEIKDKLEAME